MAKTKKAKKVKSVKMVEGTQKAKTTAVVAGYEVCPNVDKITFSKLKFEPEYSNMFTRVVHNKDEVVMTIKMKGRSDTNFPPMEVQGILKNFSVDSACDKPKMIGIQFSSGQASQLTNLVRSKAEIKLEFTQVQGQLDLKDEPDDNSLLRLGGKSITENLEEK